MTKVIKKKGDLTGSGKGDWYRFSQYDEQYKKNYDRIFGKRDMLVEKRIISKEDESSKKD